MHNKRSLVFRRSLITLVLACMLFFVAHGHSAQATVIDIMIVYDTTARTWVEPRGGMIPFANEAVNRMNQAIINTGIGDMSFRLVHVMSVEYTTTSTPDVFLKDLKPLQGGTGVFADVHTARDDYQADLVALLVDTGSAGGYVGQGYTLGSWSGSPDWGFTTNAIRSVAIRHTLTHEVGHNLGAHHSKNQKQQPGPNTAFSNPSALYSAGWYFTGNDGNAYHTIMAYNSDGYGNSYRAAPLFSTPSRSFQGATAGHADDGDNARLIRTTKDIVNAYRTGGYVGRPSWISVPAENDTGIYTVSWGASSTPNVTYVLEEATSPDFITELRRVYEGPDTFRNIIKNEAGKTFYYRVRATKIGQGISDWRAGSNGCELISLLEPPTSITVPVSSKTGNYTILWGKSSTSDVLYQLEEATSQDFLSGVRTVYQGYNTSAYVTDRSHGITYYYRVRAIKQIPGTIIMWMLPSSWFPSTSPPGCIVAFSVPENDDFANATIISGKWGRTTGNNVLATAEPDEPKHNLFNPRYSVWWRWTAPYSEDVTIDTFDSKIDTVLAVYTGNALASLTEVASNDDDPDSLSFQSKVSFHATEGTVYHIAVDSFYEKGEISLNWSLSGLGPPSSISVPVSSNRSSYTVSWGKSLSEFDSLTYILEESTGPSFLTYRTRTAYVGKNLSALITDRQNGVSYFYRVKARMSFSIILSSITGTYNIDSAWRTAGNACTVIIQLEAPSSITVPSSSDTGKYTVSWGNSTVKGVTYVVQEATDPRWWFTVREVYRGTGNSVYLTGRSHGTTYYYRVMAIKDGYQNSAWQVDDNGCLVSIESKTPDTLPGVLMLLLDDEVKPLPPPPPVIE